MISSKGQVVFYSLMLGLIIIVLALALAGPVRERIDDARNVSTDNSIGLDCSNSSISDFNKATCYVADLNIFYFIGGLIFIGISIITAKIIF